MKKGSKSGDLDIEIDSKKVEEYSFSLLSTISENQPSKLAKTVLRYFKEKHNLNLKDIYDLFGETEEFEKKYYTVPIEVFKTVLSPSEALTKYLKENCNLTYHEISTLINRDDRSVWGTYQNANKKMKDKMVIKQPTILIPVDIFKDRTLSILENITVLLKEKYNITCYKIAKLLNKSGPAIWTTYNRAKAKK